MNDSIQVPFGKIAFSELSPTDQELVKAAEDAMKMAHAPYSNFKVGSSIKLAGGSIVSGNNQENAAYPSGLCAERVALFKAKSESTESIDAIVVLAVNESGKTADAFSCGSCRQVMLEYAGLQPKPIRILMRDREGRFIILDDARLLLPFNFDSRTLG